MRFAIKQEGYGRQGLYFIFDNTQHYIQSVFPNVEGHFGITRENDCFCDEENKTYTDCDGNETTPYSDLDLFLTEMFKEEIGRILFENLDLDEYDFDFENATYEEIAEWALSY